MSIFGKSSQDNSIERRGLRAFVSRIVNRQSSGNATQHRRVNEANVTQRNGKINRLRRRLLGSPKNRILAGVSLGATVVVAAAVALSSRGTEPVAYNNAIWLDKSWTQSRVDEDRIASFASLLQQNQIGTVYAYASTLDIAGRWTGGPQGKEGFMASRADIGSFVETFRQHHAQARILAWIEVWANLDPIDGYRLDDLAVHENIADFSRLLIEDLNFDGIMLDVKPLFHDNDDFIRLIRSVRSAIGLDSPIAVAVPGDLTPIDPAFLNVPSIAPGTMWSTNYKQRVMVSADEVVLLTYQSYRNDTLDYLNWVAYHIETYVRLLETDTRILVGIPNYGGESAAHNPFIESFAAALDGIKVGLDRLDEEQRDKLTGVAIYTDEDLDQSLWNVYREKWLQR